MSPVSTSPWTVRHVSPTAWEKVRNVIEHAFGEHLSDAEAAVDHSVMEFDRLLGAHDGDEVIGTAGSYSLVMTVPGGPVPVAGVTWVGVLPTYRRRGVLTALMGRQLADLHERSGEAVAALWASEPTIYGRFGYGAANRHLSFTIPRSPDALTGVPHDPGLRLRLVDSEETLDLTEEVYAREVARRPGMPARTSEAWRRRDLFVPERERAGGTSPLRTVVAESSEGPRGYARYLTMPRWDERGPAGEVRVRALFADDPAAYAALARFLCDLDLTAEVRLDHRPVDDPLLDMLTDPRRARPVLHDGLFVRLVDVDRALASRTYAADLDVVVEIADSLPWNAGRWRLTGGPDGATCGRTTAPADLELSATDLGAAYLGGVTLLQLARAGRVQERRDGALRAASAAFGHDPLPWCPFVF